MRQEITQEQVNEGLTDFRKKMTIRLEQKGMGTLASSHEILGIINEEVYEMEMAVHKNDLEGLQEELLDIAVGAIFGYICLKNKTVDW